MATTQLSIHLVIAVFLALASLSSAADANASSSSWPFSAAVIRLPAEGADEDACSGSASPRSCPVKCFRADPVCGADGVTYWCGCGDAECAGTRVAKLGFCEVGNDGAGPQALLLVHIVWLIVVGFSVLFGVF